MKKKYYLLFMVSAFAALTSHAQTTNLLVKLKQGSDILIKSSELKTISFSGNFSNFLLTDKSTYSIANSNIMSMQFQTMIDALNPVNSNSAFKLYPNPTTGIIYFNSLENKTNPLHIYALNGTEVFSGILSASVQSMDVSFLKQGVYIVRINNTTSRLIKL